ncbi:MAG TPA: IS30 family transposase [Clostridia bacterium]|jgi:IS30 family transposase|nr:IS30 family transposase [Clostridia bacterium]
MSQVYCIRTRQKGKHLTFEEREELEALVNKNNALPKKDRISQRVMAKRMGVSPATLCRELKRGKVILRDTEWRNVMSYSAFKAQEDYDEKATAKGPHLKIANNHKLVKKIENYITKDKYSPYATIEKLKNDPDYRKTPICERTLYNYIHRELLEKVTKKDLPRKGKSSKRKYTRITKRIKDVDAKCIDERPQVANNRSEWGHWEMDCIESGRSKGRACLLVLVERMSRQVLVFKLRSQTQKEVQRRLDQLEKKIGIKRFRKIFKSITVDNGSEFLDWRNLERSYVSRHKILRTQIFYCHPYHSWERGTNEQVNGHIRRFIPKGSAIAKYSKKEILEIQKWLNEYPRKILNGKSANEIVKKELNKCA